MKSKFILTLILIGAANIYVFAQSSSSYTRFGIGDIDYSYSVRRMGMGQLGTSIADADFISIINPASTYKMGKTRIEFSLNYKGVFLSNDVKKNYFAETDFGGFTVGIPVSNDNGIGVAFGLVPFSNVSYNVIERSSSTNPLIGDYKIEYSGSGGLSKVFLSSSYLLPFNLAVGTSLDYYFGKLNYNSTVEFQNSSSFSSEYEKNYQYRGIGGTFGLITPDLAKLFASNSISDFRIGAALSLFSNLTDDSLFTASSLVGTDTISSGSGKVKVPAKFSLGTSLILSSKYTLSLDYSSQAWSKFSQNDIVSSELQDAYKISIGFEYRPLRELGLSFWEQIILRAGLSFEQTQYLIYNRRINQYSVSLGMSMPLGNENTLDFGLMYSRRGTKESNLLQEDIVKLGVGFSLGELWFIRQEK